MSDNITEDMYRNFLWLNYFRVEVEDDKHDYLTSLSEIFEYIFVKKVDKYKREIRNINFFKEGGLETIIKSIKRMEKEPYLTLKEIYDEFKLNTITDIDTIPYVLIEQKLDTIIEKITTEIENEIRQQINSGPDVRENKITKFLNDFNSEVRELLNKRKIDHKYIKKIKLFFRVLTHSITYVTNENNSPHVKTILAGVNKLRANFNFKDVCSFMNDCVNEYIKNGTYDRDNFVTFFRKKHEEYESQEKYLNNYSSGLIDEEFLKLKISDYSTGWLSKSSVLYKLGSDAVSTEDVKVEVVGGKRRKSSKKRSKKRSKKSSKKSKKRSTKKSKKRSTKMSKKRSTKRR